MIIDTAGFNIYVSENILEDITFSTGIAKGSDLGGFDPDFEYLEDKKTQTNVALINSVNAVHKYRKPQI